MKRTLFVLPFVIVAAVALAQTGTPIKQSGNVTPGHIAVFATNGVVQDGGTAAAGGPGTGIGIIASGSGICQLSGPTSGAYNRLCFNVTSTGGSIALDNIAGATGGLSFKLNGVTQTILLTDANSNITGIGVLTTAIGAGSTKTLAAAQCNNVIQWDTASGSVVTLPAATGTGCHYRLYVKTLATSNSHILYTASANGVGGSDVFVGLINGSRIDSGNAVLGFAAAGTSNTITLNRTTTGSVSLGEYVDVIDVATNIWQVSGMLSATGAAFATPFSHT